MTPDDIRPLLTADPFAKFYLNLTDGASIEVSDPSQVTFTPTGRVLVYESKGRQTYIALAHVVSIGFPSSGAGDPFFLRGRP
ncbi:MAG TPA: hypothetical protein VFG68_21185 [Fimbriiglobus sp.]|nr:hypothetical protein [Fimbriiglobus sp.]